MRKVHSNYVKTLRQKIHDLSAALARSNMASRGGTGGGGGGGVGRCRLTLRHLH
jgi:uncharacterized membrane protein